MRGSHSVQGSGPRRPPGGTLASLLTTALTAETAGSQIAAALDADQREELTAQLRGEGIALPYELLLEIDFTTLTPDDWSANSSGSEQAETVAGGAVLAFRHASTSVFGITSEGLVITNTASGGSYLELPLSSFLEPEDYDPTTDRLIVAVVGSASNLNTAGGATQLTVVNGDANEVHLAQLLYTSGQWVIRGSTIRSGSQVSSSDITPQASAPTSFRFQLELWKGAGVLRADLDVGTTPPATPTVLTHRADMVRPNQSIPAADAVDLVAPGIRCHSNPGDGGSTRFRKLLIWRLRSAA